MPSLVETMDALRADLVAKPMRIAAHRDIPFAIGCYPPGEEFALRKQLRLLAINLASECGLRVTYLSLARLVWETIRDQGGSAYLFETESKRGFPAAEQHVNHLLTSDDFRPAAESLLLKMEGMSPEKDIVFFVRAGGFAPGIYRASVLLEGLHRRTMVPAVFFYPGSARTGTDLRFYDLPVEGSPSAYNYRVRVYGAES